MLSGRSGRSATATPACRTTPSTSLNGTAGQSFGAFLARGVTLDLVGEGNDYVGKGLSGGRIIVVPKAGFRGERPATTSSSATPCSTVRPKARPTLPASPASALRAQLRRTAVVEGVGDHGCEYMTGGTVVVLGHDRAQLRGRHVRWRGLRLDEDGTSSQALQHGASLEPLEEEVAAARGASGDELEAHGRVASSPDRRRPAQALIEKHAAYTGSVQAREMLADWGKAIASSSRSCRTNIVAR
jgi:glutamate synthase (NADPH/NADH) large chain